MCLKLLEKYNIIPNFICDIWYIFLPYIVSNIGLSRSIHKYTYIYIYIYIFVCILYCIFYISIHENTFSVYSFPKASSTQELLGAVPGYMCTYYILIRI